MIAGFARLRRLARAAAAALAVASTIVVPAAAQNALDPAVDPGAAALSDDAVPVGSRDTRALGGRPARAPVAAVPAGAGSSDPGDPGAPPADWKDPLPYPADRPNAPVDDRIRKAITSGRAGRGSPRSEGSLDRPVSGPGMNAGPHWTKPAVPTWGQAWRAQLAPPAGPPPLPDMPPIGQAPARLTLREAIAAALQNNPELIAQSLVPVVQETNILEAESYFDPLTGAETNYLKSVTPATSALAGTETLSISNFNWNFFAQKNLATGATVRVDFLNNRFITNSDFQGLTPQYKPEPTISLNQPLLRGFGLYFTRLRISLAETATDAAVEDYKAAVANFVTRVVTAYWRVVLANDQLEVTRDALDLARQTVRDNKTRVDVGVLPPVAVKESEAEAARREANVIVAENALFQASRVLQQLVYLPGFSEWLPRPVEPVEHPSSEGVRFDADRILRTAVAERSEIRAARLNVEANEMNVALADNQLMPRLDAYGSYGVNALSGDPTRKTDPLNFRSIYGGTYGDALGRLLSNNFYSYGGGVRLEIPIGNSAAIAQSQRSRVQRARAEAVYRQRVSEVSLDVGQSLGDVTANMKRVEATRVARKLAEENLRNQTRRYEVGMVTTTDLLNFQNEVTNARLTENQALIDYNDSLTQLERAQGTLLRRFNVDVEPRQPTKTPWWALF
ncbi:MAG: TolC family protein [Alphaproteobacteria bacterium]